MTRPDGDLPVSAGKAYLALPMSSGLSATRQCFGADVAAVAGATVEAL